MSGQQLADEAQTNGRRQRGCGRLADIADDHIADGRPGRLVQIARLVERQSQPLPLGLLQLTGNVVAAQHGHCADNEIVIRHSRPAADDGQRIADDIGQDQAVAGSRRTGPRQATRLDPVNGAAHGVQLTDGATALEEDLDQLAPVFQRQQRLRQQRRRATGDQAEDGILGLRFSQQLDDRPCCGQAAVVRQRVAAPMEGQRPLGGRCWPLAAAGFGNDHAASHVRAQHGHDPRSHGNGRLACGDQVDAAVIEINGFGFRPVADPQRAPLAPQETADGSLRIGRGHGRADEFVHVAAVVGKTGRDGCNGHHGSSRWAWSLSRSRRA